MRIQLMCLLVAAACGTVESENPPSDAPRPPDAPAQCVAETDTAFCARLTACDPMTAADNCGTARTVDCGVCGGAGVWSIIDIILIAMEKMKDGNGLLVVKKK